MTWDAAFDIASGICLVAGALLGLAAAIGLVRFPDLLSRMHAATKPQVLGLLLVVTGVGLRLRDPGVVGVLVLVAALQLLTTPVAAHMVGRAAYRTRQVREDVLVTDELTTALESDDAGAS
ncbi:MAG TPA: monovalent cation/H(+) antiporter subunit G [Jiangellaceae bacterium]|nr:monovalent cation/H(+) antiporter subunit G [Jiangellaceae bacterium]